MESIMPESDFYYNYRKFENLHRHEIFFGKNRLVSIKYGLFVYLTPEQHNMSENGVHFNHDFDMKLKKLGQQVAMHTYNWTTEDFIRIFGKNYL